MRNIRGWRETDVPRDAPGCFAAVQFFRFWPIATNPCAAIFGRYWEHSGHWMALAPEASVANDPFRKSRDLIFSDAHT
jgi:hypothetical protein